MSYDNLPAALCALPQWVLFDRSNKVPYYIDKTRKASPTDVATWSTYADAVACVDDGFGLGFVFKRGFTGIDIDKCFVDGVLTDRARDLVAMFDSYTELSPSGNGLHIICEGMLPGARGVRKDGVEMYSRQRYFTMTGDVFDGRKEIHNRQAEISQLYHSMNTPKPEISKNPGFTERIEKTPIRSDFDDRAHAWIGSNEYVKKVWEKEIALESQSDYDLQLVIEAIDAGFNDEEALRIAQLHRTKHHANAKKLTRDDYRQSTLTTAHTMIARRLKPENVVQLHKVNDDPFVDAVTIAHAPKPTKWLIQKYLPQSGIVWLAGEWSTLKTFLALDMAFHIATGKPWCGHAVHQGKVIYIAGEGFSGLGKRLKGLELFYQQPLSAKQILFTPLAVMINEQKPFMDFSRAMGQHHPDPALIVIDTKSANMTGSDSDPAIMNAFINHLRILEKTSNCLILVIDHVGHMSKDRPRGVSQQMGAADAVYMIQRDKERDEITLRTEKDPKDFPSPAMRVFKPIVIDLPEDWNMEGEASTTLVLEPTVVVDIKLPERTNTSALKDSQKEAIALLHELRSAARSLASERGSDPERAQVQIAHFRQELIDRNITNRPNSYRMVKALEERGLVVQVGVDLVPVDGAWQA